MSEDINALSEQIKGLRQDLFAQQQLKKDIIEVLSASADKILQLSNLISTNGRNLFMIEKNMQEIDDELMDVIIVQKNEEGKYRFTNQSQRDSALRRMRKHHSQYQSELNKKLDIDSIIAELKNKLDYLGKKQRNYRALAYMLGGPKEI
jgi:hypothetical protein